MRRQWQVARLNPAVVLEALLLRRQPLQVGLLPLQFLRSGRAAPDPLASRAHDAGPLERQELERAPDVEDLAAGRVASWSDNMMICAHPLTMSTHSTTYAAQNLQDHTAMVPIRAGLILKTPLPAR